MFACSLKIHGLRNNLDYLEQNSGFKSITKISPCYVQTFHTVGPSEKKKITLLPTLSQAARKIIILRWPGEAFHKL
jgi:hypothetical protein